jgi:NADPH-dependent ferric siderophore reductase
MDAAELELDVDVVVHEGGRASEWAVAAGPGDAAAVSGPARGYDIDPESPGFFLAGDETAIPAISQLLERLPANTPVAAHIEMASETARFDLPAPHGATVTWLLLPPGAPPGDSLVGAVRDAELATGTRVWVAGEAAGVQRVRRFLFDTRGYPRAHATVRGYWKSGRAGDDEV